MLAKSKTLTGISLMLISLSASAINFTGRGPIEKNSADSYTEMFSKGITELSFQLRYEDLEAYRGSDVFKGAQSTTLRTRLSFETAEYNYMSAYLEFDDIRAIPDDANYFDGSNGQQDDLYIAAPESTEVNQAWFKVDVINTALVYGRQALQLDNGRFIGSEDWTQNQGAFSGLSLTNESLNVTRVRAGRLYASDSLLDRSAADGSHRIDGSYFNLEYGGFIHSKLSLYWYDIDRKDTANTWDSSTYGIRFAGYINNEPSIEYAFEWAQQEDAGANPLNYKAGYSVLELGATIEGVRVFVGREVLGSDGGAYFVFPLGQEHQFQGYTGQFSNSGLGNIEGGVEDNYFSLGYVLNEDSRLIATFHEFRSDDDSVGEGSLGKEWSLVSRHKMEACGGLELSLGFAKYTASGFSEDARKFWLTSAIAF